jgi:hypothetical protein
MIVNGGLLRRLSSERVTGVGREYYRSTFYIYIYENRAVKLKILLKREEEEGWDG